MTSSENLADLVGSTVSIPTIPATLLALEEVCANPDSDADDIAAVIEHDPAVAAKVLRLVNSSIYSLSSAVNSISVACTMVGRRVLHNIVLQATVLETFSTDAAADFDINRLWDHSFKSAVAMQRLVSKSSLTIGLSRDDAYTCGLMHDVGKVLLHQSEPEQFAEAMKLAKEQDIPLARAEHATFGFTHADVGGMLADRWKLSDELQAAIWFHHSPSTESEQAILGMFAHVASSLAHEAADADPAWRPDYADPKFLRTLGIADEDLDEIRDAVAATKLDC